ncbi:MAG: ABC transporter ATP-binding protein [Candidatus Aminicenantes bacterium]|nr:ABC transporter ATP-binding protein [Candidatus Aminicenantes bacterium]
MIKTVNIEKTYVKGSVSTHVLRGITLSIDQGEYVAIMGTSGTGKTTLMNILGCLDKPTSGKLELDGVDVYKLNDDALSALRNKKFGFVFQQFFLLERTTALDNVLLPFIYADRYPADAIELAKKSLASVGLEDRIEYLASELSGGQQQRVAIARALINDPDVILADEPTGNLDSRSTDEILEIFSRLHKEGRTMVVVTHDQAVARYAQRILELKDGQVRESSVANPQK